MAQVPITRQQSSTPFGFVPQVSVAEILKSTDFRRLWFSNGLAFMGIRVQDMIVAWLVLDMTDSMLWVGLVNGLPTISIIFFALLGGVLADRRDRRTILVWSRLTLGAMLFLEGFLVTSGMVALWQVILIALVTVGVGALDVPTAFTLVSDSVKKEKLVSANSITFAAMNLGAIAGPFAGGMLIADVGVDAALYLLGSAYIGAFFIVLRIRKRPSVASSQQSNPINELVDGFRYVLRTPRTTRLVALSVSGPLAGVFLSMVPAMTRDVLHSGPETLGTIMGFYGIGALIGSLMLTAKGGVERKGLVVMLTALIYGSGIVISAFVSHFELFLVIAATMGGAAMWWRSTTIALVQSSTDQEMKGRVMSIFGLGMQMFALGWLVGGALATVIGIQPTLVLAGVAMIALNGYVYSSDAKHTLTVLHAQS